MPDTNDHDLLIELRGDVKAMRFELSEIKDNIKSRVDDHEKRIRSVETTLNQGRGSERVIQGLIATVAVAAVELILKVFLHL